MGRESHIDELLSRHETAQAQGRALSPEELCRDYPELLEDVRGRIADLLSMDSLLLSGPNRMCPGTRAEGAAGAVAPPAIAGYEVVGELGRGGMGVVYQARHTRLNRLVALKMILAGGHAGPHELARFRVEAEAVARLQHPHIVQIYEVGEHNNQPYLVLELVDGGSLARQLAGTPLAPTAAARLVETLARAVHYAHGRGVVHRDLTLANVLLTAEGVPKITDFGLARRLDTEGAGTRTGVTLGTPPYMAPEQAAGRVREIGPATDVYALGAILYEAVTGRPPYQAATPVETMLQVMSAEVVPPRRLQPGLPRDLETVCLKCLERDPARRYGSAGEVADDLGRWLAGAPVRARRAGPWERAGKWVRRRPALAALLAVTALSVIALVAGLLWHNDRLRAEADRTARERDAARKAQRSARRAVNDMYTQVAEQWLADTPRMTDVQREFLTKALAFYEEVVSEPGAEPEDRLELGRALYRLATLRSVLAQPQAEASYRESVRVLEALVAEHPGVPEHRLELARSYNGLGHTLTNYDQFPEAETVLAQAHAEAERLHQHHPEHPDYRLELATAQWNLGMLLVRTDRLLKARDAFMQARDQTRWLSDRWPAMTRYRELLAWTSVSLGQVLFELSSLSEAEECFLQARNLLDALRRESPTRPFPRRVLAHSWEGLGWVLLAVGRVEDAEKAAGLSVDLRRRFQDDFYRDAPPQWHALAAARMFHGSILARLGRFREAEVVLAAALPLQEKVVEVTQNGRRGEELAVLEGSLAWLRLRQPVSGSTVRELLPRLQRARALAPRGERFRLALLGLAHYRLGDWDQALTVLRQPDAGPAPGSGPCRWTTDDSLIRRMAEHQEDIAPVVRAFCLAMTYHRLGRREEAVDCYRRGLRLSQAQQTLPGFRSVDVETIRAEAADLLGLREQPAAPRKKR
jgi:tetratricopeptide (TPR) repeat protein